MTTAEELQEKQQMATELMKNSLAKGREAYEKSRARCFELLADPNPMNLMLLGMICSQISTALHSEYDKYGKGHASVAASPASDWTDETELLLDAQLKTIRDLQELLEAVSKGGLTEIEKLEEKQ